MVSDDDMPGYLGEILTICRRRAAEWAQAMTMRLPPDRIDVVCVRMVIVEYGVAPDDRLIAVLAQDEAVFRREAEPRRYAADVVHEAGDAVRFDRWVRALEEEGLEREQAEVRALGWLIRSGVDEKQALRVAGSMTELPSLSRFLPDVATRVARELDELRVSHAIWAVPSPKAEQGA